MYNQQLIVGLAELPDSLDIRNTYRYKPKNALWSSSWIDGSSAWVEWCQLEDFGIPEDGVWSGYIIQARPNANIIQIDSFKDLEKLHSKYSIIYSADSFFLGTLDFESMRKNGIDGIHLTANGEYATRYTKTGLYGWDCESTCWLSLAFDVVESVQFPVRNI
ncbi:hypothetical protein [Thermoactinomyces sp. DSM 45892]|uniref:hypothetical protein n=1 Tax=Thermoactinomyces sp. DSM 45892 TaxID=1882753 RepID=UPI00089B382C|nr:hypothetical protein [Thermoactinomyces sp. DSM 45892]SDY86281.1 hypothetical protein SAMN05444416_109104 [Thermoactinomyces sp. DSM 45892]